ncbi:MAG: ABC-2 transporter permease [Bacillus sp. (in: Bacteria)]|nr:ABC-2 transporter permease [Bacillus sp. (in: firmicutes)]
MKTLIKRDILSTKNVWLFVVIIIGAVSFLNTYIDKSQEVTGGENLFLPAILMGFLGYGIVAHICRVEDLNKVNERIYQIPISVEKLILSRFISSFILIGLVISLMVLFLAFAHFVLNTSFHLMGAGVNAIYFTIHVILLIVSVYLPFYFAKGSNAATWAVRLTFVFWFMYAILAMPLYYHEWLGQFYSMPSIYYRIFAENLVITSFILIVISYFTAILLYKRNRQRKPQISHLTTYMSVILAILLIVPFFTESRAALDVDEFLSSVTLEEVSIIPVMAETWGEEKEYTLDVKLTLSLPMNYRNHDVMRTTRLTIKYLGIPSIPRLNNHWWYSLDSFDEFWGDSGTGYYYTYTFSYFEPFTESEANELLQEFNRQQFRATLENTHTPNQKIELSYE